MPQPYTEPNQKEEITPEEYASGRDVGRTYTPNEYVTSGSAPQEYPAGAGTAAQHRGEQSRGSSGEGNRQRGYYETTEASNWSTTTTGHAPQIYPAAQSQAYATPVYAAAPPQPRHAQRGSYQPQRRNRPNVDRTERQLAVAAGGVLLVHALMSRSSMSLLTGALGAALVWHGQSRRSPLYEALDVNTARQPLWGDGDGWSQRQEQPRAQSWQQSSTQPQQERRYRNAIEIERAVTINKPAEELYQYWRKLENLPNFMEHLQTVEQIDEKRSHWVARLAGGLPVAWDAEIVEDQPNERIVWRTLPDAQVQQSGVVTFKPTNGERGTVVKVDIKYSPPGGIVGETFARMLNGITAQQVKDDIRRFKSLMETGEVPTTEGQPSGRA